LRLRLGLIVVHKHQAEARLSPLHSSKLSSVDHDKAGDADTSPMARVELVEMVKM
jgi:hypothetical protein